MANFKKLSDDELSKAEGGINWQKFGSCILSNGGGATPKLAELVAAIVSNNWPLVAVLSNSAELKTNPVVIKCSKSS